MITENQVFTYIKNKILVEYPNAFVVSESIYATSRFPTVCITQREVHGVDFDLSITSMQKQCTFEVQAYSNKKNGAKLEVKEIIEVVISAFMEIGFRLTYSDEIANQADNTIKRHVARFTRLVCDGDNI